MRGGLFEGFIISELIKNRLNRGETPEIWFWRDNAGLEIDCLLMEGSKLMALEIKSGKTFSDEMLDGLKEWQKIDTETPNRILIYAGSTKTVNRGIKLMPWKEVASL